MAAVTFETYVLNEHGTVGAETQVAQYVNGALYANDSDFQWMALSPEYNHSALLTVLNQGTTTITLAIRTENLPVGWTEAWDWNPATPVLPKQWANGTLTLYVSPTAGNGTYTWKRYIDVTVVG